MFGQALLFSVSFYQLKKEGLQFFRNISEVGVELAGSEQVTVENFMVLLQVLSAAMRLYAEGTFISGRQGQIGKAVIVLLFVILSAGDGFHIEHGKCGVDLVHPNRFFSCLIQSFFRKRLAFV